MALVLVSVGGLLLTACSDDDSDDRDTDESTTTLSPEAEVEAAYLAFWEMAMRLAERPDPVSPELRMRASGEALANLIDGIARLQMDGQHSEFGPQYRHEVLTTQVEGTTAVIEDCAVDDSRVVETATGEPVVEGIGTELLSVDLVHDGDRWLVDRFTRIDAWEGVVECR